MAERWPTEIVPLDPSKDGQFYLVTWSDETSDVLPHREVTIIAAMYRIALKPAPKEPEQ